MKEKLVPTVVKTVKCTHNNLVLLLVFMKTHNNALKSTTLGNNSNYIYISKCYGDSPVCISLAVESVKL